MFKINVSSRAILVVKFLAVDKYIFSSKQYSVISFQKKNMIFELK